MFKNLWQIDRFRLVYWVIAFATAQHTAWGAATTMQGSSGEGQLGWWLQGLAFAIGIDFLMVQVATKIRQGVTANRRWYLTTFATVAIVSFYFQLLYTWKHVDILTTGNGVAVEWVVRLQGIINARVVLAPIALPLVATLYTIGGLGKGGEAQPPRKVATQSRATELQSKQPEPITIEKPQPLQLPSTVQGIAIRDTSGKLEGWECPGCHKQLSIAGWSRHKHKCPALVQISNGG